MTDEIWYSDATEMARRVREGQVSPVELLDTHLDRIQALNPRINAVVTLVEDARDRARAAEQALSKGESLGPLHGVPFTIKDCVDTAGVRTTRGSKLFQDHVPAADATVVRRLIEAGGVFMAKTNMPEFALWWESDNVVFGRTLNPWNRERTPGGSSGGEAAALSAGLSPLGIGSDVGGSIRNPAHNCGIVGLKATHGRVPLTGHWPETLLRAMHVGPMARSVRDVSLALSIIAGPDGVDPYAVPVPLSGPADDASLSGLRVGWNTGQGFGPVHPEVKAAVEKAASLMAEAGCRVEEVSLPALENRDTQRISMVVFSSEAGLYLEPLVAGREAELSPNIQRRLALPKPEFRQYLEALEDWEGLKRDMAAFFDGYDLLLCPCVPVPAHPHDITELDVAGETVAARNALRATIPWDLTGSPALSVPYAMSSDGLPIGVQIVGRHFDEATVLQAGAVLERANDPATWRPPV